MVPLGHRRTGPVPAFENQRSEPSLGQLGGGGQPHWPGPDNHHRRFGHFDTLSSIQID